MFYQHFICIWMALISVKWTQKKKRGAPVQVYKAILHAIIFTH